VSLAGNCGVPATARAVVANLTVVSPTGAGYLAFWPAGGVPPLAAAITFAPGQLRSNNAILRVGSGGTAALATHASVAGGGTVHLVIDVNGYFE
jgi:hypothetical protein